MGEGMTAALVCGVIGLIVLFVVRAVRRYDTATDLEAAMKEDNEKSVRALFAARGHLLRRSTKDAVNVWLIERENAQKDG